MINIYRLYSSLLKYNCSVRSYNIIEYQDHHVLVIKVGSKNGSKNMWGVDYLCVKR